MSPDHKMSDRVYGNLKADILGGGLAYGRLNLASLEALYSSSATPVREALLRLVGEGLVDLLRRGGFAVHEPDGHELRELYELNLRVMTLVTTWRRPDRRALETLGMSTGSLQPPIDMLFRAIAQTTASASFVALVEAHNDRLHRVRLVEQVLFPMTDDEFSSIAVIALTGTDRELRRALSVYHRRRILAVNTVVEMMNGAKDRNRRR